MEIYTTKKLSNNAVQQELELGYPDYWSDVIARPPIQPGLKRGHTRTVASSKETLFSNAFLQPGSPYYPQGCPQLFT